VWRYFARRLVSALPLLFVSLLFTFLLVKLAPGSPFQSDSPLAPEVKAALSAKFGLDEPLPVQFWRYLSAVAQGDLGQSFVYPDRAVQALLWEAFPVSALIGFLAMLFACLVGIPLGVLAGVQRSSFFDRFAMGGLMLGKSVPSIVVAPLVVTFFALVWNVFPTSGGAFSLLGPVFCLGIYDVSGIARLARTSYLEVAGQRYLVTARAKGLTEQAILWKHALRETLLPLVVYLGPAFSGILVGTVVVEQVFNLPGLGRYLVQSAQNRDTPLLLGIALFSCVLVIFFNLLSDLLFAWLDPRVRLTK
jgi:oligopeptide transport system permease protein